MGQESKTELKRTPSLFTIHESQQTSKGTTGDMGLIEDEIASMWVKPARLDDLHPADAERYVCKLCSPPKGRRWKLTFKKRASVRVYLVQSVLIHHKHGKQIVISTSRSYHT